MVLGIRGVLNFEAELVLSCLHVADQLVEHVLQVCLLRAASRVPRQLLRAQAHFEGSGRRPRAVEAEGKVAVIGLAHCAVLLGFFRDAVTVRVLVWGAIPAHSLGNRSTDAGMPRLTEKAKAFN